MTRPVEGANAAAAEEALLETAAVEGPSTRPPEVNRAEMEPTAKEVPKAGSNREGRAAGLPAAVLTPGPPRRRTRPSPEAAVGAAPHPAPRVMEVVHPVVPVRPVDSPRLLRGKDGARNKTRSTTRVIGATTSPPRRIGTTRSTRDLSPTRRCSRRRGSRGSLAEACSSSRVGPGRPVRRDRSRRPLQRRHRPSARRSRQRQGTPSPLT